MLTVPEDMVLYAGARRTILFDAAGRLARQNIEFMTRRK